MNIESIQYRWSFWWDQELVHRLISLVFSGQKTATTWLYMDNEVYGKVGEYAIIYDESTGNDLCIIQYIRVEIKPFLDVNFEYIQKEWEWDLSIESWRTSHRDFYLREYPGKLDEDSLVVCEEFILIQIL